MKVILLMAITVDGMIGTGSDHLADWTSKEDKKLFVKLTKEAGVLIMGKNTYDTIGRPLPNRLNVIMTLHPEIEENIEGSLLFTKTPPAQLLKELEAKGFDTIILAGGATINGLFAKGGLIDEMIVTVEPKLFGAGLPLFKGVSLDQDLELLSHEKINEHAIKLHYKFK